MSRVLLDIWIEVWSQYGKNSHGRILHDDFLADKTTKVKERPILVPAVYPDHSSKRKFNSG